MKNVFLATLVIPLIQLASLSAHAVTIKDTRAAGLLYGFLSAIEQPQNAGDGVLIATADLSCSKVISKSPVVSDSYECTIDIGGISGDLAQTVFSQLPAASQENFDGISVRTGTASCFSIEVSGKAPRFECK